MKIVITRQALGSLKDSLNFYLKEMEVPKEVVSRLKTDLFSACKKLSTEPYLGQEEPFLAFLNLGHRRLLEGNFKIIYRIVNKQVIITDFFDTRRNPSKIKP
ncbi:hypothetical protein Aoki45_26030 [Algoriphagus sp. oki45]|uniref:type II toxin-antitoxin system RelE/ParE family toxin n=1 Tax=Algoriphagus sp. oki45 TaxID=3067294 RepID=UPI0027EE60CC|nr:hypothetical protein Aoki45_26030 [Algoriphagus sp. oki45]